MFFRTPSFFNNKNRFIPDRLDSYSPALSEALLAPKSFDVWTGETSLHWPLRMGLILGTFGLGMMVMNNNPAWIPYFSKWTSSLSSTWNLMQTTGLLMMVLSIGMMISLRLLFLLPFILAWPVMTLNAASSAHFFIHALESMAYLYFPILLAILHYCPDISYPRSYLLKELKLIAVFSKFQSRTLYRLGLVALSLSFIAHGSYGVFLQESYLVNQYYKMGLNFFVKDLGFLSFAVGSIEIFLGLFIWTRHKYLSVIFMGMFLWKLATESLFVLTDSSGGILMFFAHMPQILLPLVLFYLIKIEQRYSSLISGTAVQYTHAGFLFSPRKLWI